VRGLGQAYPGRTLWRDLTFSLHEGGRLGIVGRNGSGKTTLLEAMRGTLRPESGDVVWAPGTRLGYLAQEVAVEGLVVGGRTAVVTVKLASSRRMAVMASGCVAGAGKTSSKGLSSVKVVTLAQSMEIVPAKVVVKLSLPPVSCVAVPVKRVPSLSVTVSARRREVSASRSKRSGRRRTRMQQKDFSRITAFQRGWNLRLRGERDH
jgi:energy-coupling factor transporter ATP-binding protein EcfA2